MNFSRAKIISAALALAASVQWLGSRRYSHNKPRVRTLIKRRIKNKLALQSRRAQRRKHR